MTVPRPERASPPPAARPRPDRPVGATAAAAIENIPSRLSDVHQTVWDDVGLMTCRLKQDYTFEGPHQHMSSPTSAVLRREGGERRIVMLHTIPGAGATATAIGASEDHTFAAANPTGSRLARTRTVEPAAKRYLRWRYSGRSGRLCTCGGGRRLAAEVRFCVAPDGTRIAYAIHGSGLPLVRTATWLTHLEFDWQNPVWRHWLDGLAEEHTVLRYDERGCGLSDRDVQDLSLDARVADLQAVIDAAGLQRVALLGMSQGGPVAVAYAARHPEPGQSPDPVRHVRARAASA
jgi:hypothetical protein